MGITGSQSQTRLKQLSTQKGGEARSQDPTEGKDRVVRFKPDQHTHTHTHTRESPGSCGIREGLCSMSVSARWSLARSPVSSAVGLNQPGVPAHPFGHLDQSQGLHYCGKHLPHPPILPTTCFFIEIEIAPRDFSGS